MHFTVKFKRWTSPYFDPNWIIWNQIYENYLPSFPIWRQLKCLPWKLLYIYFGVFGFYVKFKELFTPYTFLLSRSCLRVVSSQSTPKFPFKIHTNSYNMNFTAWIEYRIHIVFTKSKEFIHYFPKWWPT